jgi:hypothetical protein
MPVLHWSLLLQLAFYGITMCNEKMDQVLFCISGNLMFLLVQVQRTN